MTIKLTRNVRTSTRFPGTMTEWPEGSILDVQEKEFFEVIDDNGEVYYFTKNEEESEEDFDCFPTVSIVKIPVLGDFNYMLSYYQYEIIKK